MVQDYPPNSGLTGGQRTAGDDARVNHAARVLAASFWRGGGDEQYHFLLWMCAAVVRTVYDADETFPAPAEPAAPEHVTESDDDGGNTSEEFAEMLAEARELRLLRAVAEAARALYDVVDPTDCYESEHCALGVALVTLDGGDRG